MAGWLTLLSRPGLLGCGAAVGDKIRARTNSVGLPAAATAAGAAAKGAAVPSKLSKSTTSGSLEPVTQDDLKQLKAELLAEFRQELNQLKKELLQGTGECAGWGCCGWPYD